ncbi:hypothetical protein KIS4809_3782 [Bacillus sp. ZZV12-4809]|nr:hypothetical protein KIS4809_3782 [Bacillus sp. ZZV12-4809]
MALCGETGCLPEKKIFEWMFIGKKWKPNYIMQYILGNLKGE